MTPITDPYGNYIAQLAQVYPGLDDKLAPYVPAGSTIHDVAQEYGPGGNLYHPELQQAAARASGRLQPAAFAVQAYIAAGMGSVGPDGRFMWAAPWTAPFTGMPAV